MSRVARNIPHCQKWDCHALPLFALDRAIARLFPISILIAGETKNGRAKSTRWSVWQPCFWGCDMTLGTPSAASKVHPKDETTKGRKDDTNIHVLNWGGPPLGVQILYTFPAPKTGIKQIEQFNDIILHILRSRLESQSWNSFNSFPIVNEVSAGRCTDSARLRQDSATKDIKTGTELW